ncbi:MAG: hypothetical protein ACLR23_05155 [Clostridia bacterium]
MMAKVNGKLRELPFQLDEDCSVEFLDMEHPDGYRVYRRTVYYLFIRSAHEVLGRQIQIKIRHSIGHGSYCEIWRRKRGGAGGLSTVDYREGSGGYSIPHVGDRPQQ